MYITITYIGTWFVSYTFTSIDVVNKINAADYLMISQYRGG